MTPWAGTAERERIGQVGAFAGGAGFDQVGGSPPADERAGPADDDDDDEVDGDAGSHEEFHRAPMTPCAGTAERERIGQVGAFAGGANLFECSRFSHREMEKEGVTDGKTEKKTAVSP